MPRAWQKLVDCISSVWSQYDELESETLGAVVVVLEGFEATNEGDERAISKVPELRIEHGVYSAHPVLQTVLSACVELYKVQSEEALPLDLCNRFF